MKTPYELADQLDEAIARYNRHEGSVADIYRVVGLIVDDVVDTAKLTFSSMFEEGNGGYMQRRFFSSLDDAIDHDYDWTA